MSSVSDNLFCAFPVITHDRFGDSLVVPCGKCPACLSRKNSVNLSKVLSLFASHKYALFVTLTYDNDHLPYFSVNSLLPSSRLNDARLSSLSDYIAEDSFLLRRCYTNTLTAPSEVRMPQYVVSQILNKYYCYDTQKRYKAIFHGFHRVIPVLNPKDPQDFLKRLRKRTDKYGPISYALCGEYAPLHFRPHYHAILFCDSEALFSRLPEYVYSSWQNGDVDSKPADKGSAYYVASYVSTNSTLSGVLAKFAPQFRQYFRCSRLEISSDLFQGDPLSLSEPDLFDSDCFIHSSTDLRSVYSNKIKYYLRAGFSPLRHFSLRCAFRLYVQLFELIKDSQRRYKVNSIKAAIRNLLPRIYFCRYIGTKWYFFVSPRCRRPDAHSLLATFLGIDSFEFVEYDVFLNRVYSALYLLFRAPRYLFKFNTILPRLSFILFARLFRLYSKLCLSSLSKSYQKLSDLSESLFPGNAPRRHYMRLYNHYFHLRAYGDNRHKKIMDVGKYVPPLPDFLIVAYKNLKQDLEQRCKNKSTKPITDYAYGL